MSLTETQDFSRALIQGAPLAAAGFRARRPCEFIVVLNALDADAIAAGAQTGESESAVSKSTLAPGSSRPVFERVNWGAKSTKSRYLRLSTGDSSIRSRSIVPASVASVGINRRGLF